MKDLRKTNKTLHSNIWEKREYNIKYYSTHKEKVDKYINEYLKKERLKENSKFADYQRQVQKIVINSPEEMEKRRLYAQNYYNKKRLEKQQAKTQN